MKSKQANKIGRNTLCPCGSSKKYKKCCGAEVTRSSPKVPVDNTATLNRAMRLFQAGNLNNAYDLCKTVLLDDSDNLIALELSSYILFHKGQIDNAAEMLEKALIVDPSQAELYCKLGNIRKSQHRLDNGIAHINRAIELKPDFAEAYIDRANALGLQGKVDEAIQDYRKALSLNPSLDVGHINLLLMLNFSTKISDEDISKEHYQFASLIESRHKLELLTHIPVQSADKRLRIGYVSSDFFTHSVAYYIAPVFECHNRDEFEIYAYYANTINDDFTQKLKNDCEHWRNVASLNDQALEDQIRKDKIDILVDLSGYTAKSRIKVFARKPAPLQVTWLGYPNTTGLSRMDYRLTDKIADPEGSDELYTETLYRLPQNFSVYQPPAECPDVADAPCLGNRFITFGSFNNFSKTNASVVELWARLLTEVPGSRLLLKNPALGDRSMQEKVCDAFVNNGVDVDRLLLLGRDIKKHDHFQRYAQLDIALDPFPYNGTTTTCEALWMGVPVVTLAGNSHRARVGASLLTHIGHQEWIAETVDEYVSIAKQLASNCESLSSIRRQLRDEMKASPLTDASAFTLDLEKAYQEIWKNHF